MIAETSMTDEVKTVAEEDSFLSINTYNKTTQHEEFYRREHAEHEDLYKSSLHLYDELRQPHVNYISSVTGLQ